MEDVVKLIGWREDLCSDTLLVGSALLSWGFCAAIDRTADCRGIRRCDRRRQGDHHRAQDLSSSFPPPGATIGRLDGIAEIPATTSASSGG
jgi:hypothetical protein